ncbi:MULTISPECIES: C40 family peptidase [unclassified Paenibacillus]|uniref:C40 family peptidase n=1 Tax=unclassified Paenibacillus TaxID=185978 RepID=UPI00363207E0
MKKLVIASTVALSLLFPAIGLTMPTAASAQESYATNGHKFVNTAKSYIGKVTYRFGTRDPQHLTFDCSAFTQFVFSQNGINLPWGSSAQAQFGSRVPNKAQLSIGDLIMFSVNKPGHIDHVGIYIGNGEFISNTKSSGVVISSLNTGYWSTRYITARHY